MISNVFSWINGFVFFFFFKVYYFLCNNKSFLNSMFRIELFLTKPRKMGAHKIKAWHGQQEKRKKWEKEILIPS